jgi:hypothetical protein
VWKTGLSLRDVESTLVENKNMFVMHNRDDFLVSIEDLDYLEGRYCQELWIGGAWLGGFLPIFLVFTAFDLNTINERNTSTHQG